jgi:hypothetical protein
MSAMAKNKNLFLQLHIIWLEISNFFSKNFKKNYKPNERIFQKQIFILMQLLATSIDFF